MVVHRVLLDRLGGLLAGHGLHDQAHDRARGVLWVSPGDTRLVCWIVRHRATLVARVGTVTTLAEDARVGSVERLHRPRGTRVHGLGADRAGPQLERGGDVQAGS